MTRVSQKSKVPFSIKKKCSNFKALSREIFRISKGEGRIFSNIVSSTHLRRLAQSEIN